MKSLKKISAIVIATTMLTLAACNGANKSAAEILAEAEKKVVEAKSMAGNMSLDMSMKMFMYEEKVTMDILSEMNTVVFQKPTKMYIDGYTIMETMGQSMDMKSKIYVLEKDNIYTVYMNMAELGWMKEEMDMSLLTQYNPQASIELYWSNTESFKEIGEETLEGNIKATKYNGAITGDAIIYDVMKSSGVMDALITTMPADMNLAEL
ncbi:hypothetical protein V6615_12065 [Oscillospiraceae bacterium PP1C4]